MARWSPTEQPVVKADGDLPQREVPTAVQAEWHEAWLKLQRALEEHRESQERFLWRAAAEASTEASLASLARTASAAAAAELSDPGDAGAASGANWASGVSTQEGPGPRHSETTQRLEDRTPCRTSERDTRPWHRKALAVEVSERLSQIGQSPGVAPTQHEVLEAAVLRGASWWLELREPPRSGPAASLIRSSAWQALVAVSIAANVVVMMLVIDRQMSNLGEEVPAALRNTESGLTAFFGFEVLLRLWVHRLFFFCNDAWKWSVFDLVLVAQSCFDLVSDMVVDDEPSKGNISFLRTLRLLRFARALRVVRVLQFALPLRRMALSLMGSFASLFWSLVMLAFVLSLLSLVMMQFVANGLLATPLEDGEQQELMHNFGSVMKTVLSFYMATSGGENWVVYYDLLAKVAWEAALLLVLVVAFMEIAMLNILTGMFVETALKLAEPDRDTLALERRRSQFQQAHELEDILRKIDVDGSGTISREEFRMICCDARMHAAMSVMGLDVRDPDLVFAVLQNACHVEEVDNNVMLDACMKMKGPATSLEVQTLAYRLLMLNDRLDAVDRTLAQSSVPRSVEAVGVAVGAKVNGAPP